MKRQERSGLVHRVDGNWRCTGRVPSGLRFTDTGRGRRRSGTAGTRSGRREGVRRHKKVWVRRPRPTQGRGRKSRLHRKTPKDNSTSFTRCERTEYTHTYTRTGRVRGTRGEKVGRVRRHNRQGRETLWFEGLESDREVRAALS